MSTLLLDTCALIYIAEGQWITDEARQAVRSAMIDGSVLVSPISAWEIGLLARPGKTDALMFIPDAKTWYARFMALDGVCETPFTSEIALSSTQLPEPLHGDPADRILIATARFLGVPIITRDRRILEYGQVGNVRTIAC